MADIVTLTLNPAVDVATSIDHVSDTHKLRCGPARRDPGGGGINVARVLQRLGCDCHALYLAGGAIGQMLRQLLASERVSNTGVEIAGETRENFSVHESLSGREFRFVLPGPKVTADELQCCLDQLNALPVAPRYLVLSGSLPLGAEVDTYAQITSAVDPDVTRVVLDTSGPALASALDAGVYLVKPSLSELRALTGQALSDEREWRAVAQEIVDSGRAQMVALTLGENGALLVSAERTLRAPALPVRVSSVIGAGDSFVAGMVWALNRNADLDEVFQYALAAATAALLSAGTGLCQHADVERIYRELAHSR